MAAIPDDFSQAPMQAFDGGGRINNRALLAGGQRTESPAAIA
jgi:hypothetical protein